MWEGRKEGRRLRSLLFLTHAHIPFHEAQRFRPSRPPEHSAKIHFPAGTSSCPLTREKTEVNFRSKIEIPR